MNEKRCGSVFTVDGGSGGDSEACCCIPTWDDADRCKWHLDRSKADVLSRPLRIAGCLILNDAIFRDASLAGSSALADRSLRRCDFSGADLSESDLSGSDLRGTDFTEADLRGVDLCGADLRDADLSEADLRDASLTDADARAASFRRANLEQASLVRTNLCNASVEEARLYEGRFSDTWINEGTELGEQCVYELDSNVELERDELSIDRLEAAAWTYREFEQLCRENALPHKTRTYYVREKDTRRKAAWEVGDYHQAIKSEVSRWVMQYGSNPWRIVGVSALVILVWAFLYPLTGGLLDTSTERVFGYAVETPVDHPRYYATTVFLKSLYFSVVTFATLGYGDIQPVGSLARGLATVETLLGSLLTALLVFVLSRVVTW